MATTFKKEVAGLSVHFNDLFVAMIYKVEKSRDGYPPNHYGLAYNTGRYERFDTLAQAREAAQKICAKKDITGRVVLY